MDLKLNSSGDLDTTDNEMTLVQEEAAIAQHLRIRLRTFLGEWFLDTRQGIPYFEEFLIKNPSQIVMGARLREAIIETPGIASLDELQFEFDAPTRNMTVTFKATLDTGTDFNFTYDEFIIGD